MEDATDGAFNPLGAVHVVSLMVALPGPQMAPKVLADVTLRAPLVEGP